MFTFSNTPQIGTHHHLPKPSFSGSIRNLPGLYIHQTYREKSPHQTFGFGRYQGYMEQKSRWGLWFLFFSAGKAMDFWRILFLPNQTEVIGLVLLENGKNEWKLLVTSFFFCNLFFCFRFLVANGFCNYWFEPVLKIFSVPKTSFLLWKSAIPKRNLSPNHHFLGAMLVLRCLFS